MASPSKRLPADLAAAQSRIDKWRSDSRARRPIPNELWEMAVDLVPTHGVYRVSRALRLRYDKVKAKAKTCHSRRRVQSKPAFVQVAAPTLAMPSPPGELTVELTDESGRQMTIRSSTGMDAAALVAAFCGKAS
ncbi:hypothetical protein ACFL6C_05325 [Myxococcota bacterium]